MAAGSWEGIAEKSEMRRRARSGYSVAAVMCALVDGVLFTLSGCAGVVLLLATGGSGEWLVLAFGGWMSLVGVGMVAGALRLMIEPEGKAGGLAMLSAAMGMMTGGLGLILDLYFILRGPVDGAWIFRFGLTLAMTALAGVVVGALLKVARVTGSGRGLLKL